MTTNKMSGQFMAKRDSVYIQQDNIEGWIREGSNCYKVWSKPRTLMHSTSISYIDYANVCLKLYL